MEGHRYAEWWHVLEGDCSPIESSPLKHMSFAAQASSYWWCWRSTTVWKTSMHRSLRGLFRLVRRFPFTNSTDLKRMWLPRRQISMGTVRNRLHSAGYRVRRPIKRPLLTRQHKQGRLGWCQARRRWNLANWRKVHWSDESRFFFCQWLMEERACGDKQTRHMSRETSWSDHIRRWLYNGMRMHVP